MEIYRALSDYASPPQSVNVLSFSKGDQFEVLEDDKSYKEWWGARRLHDNAVGYVPAKYMKYHERRVGKLFTDIERRERDIQLKKLEEMQNQSENTFPEVPQPDYSDEEDYDSGSQPFKRKLTQVYANVPLTVPYDDFHESQGSDTGEPLDIDYDEPAPDYDDHETDHGNGQSSVNGTGQAPGLISPKKLTNPCQKSQERQDLHRELLLNNKMGINILKKKPELQRELERRKESQKKREWELYKEQKKTLFERKMEEQAHKLKMQEEQERSAVKVEQERPEFLKVHDKIRSKSS